ncbi:MAG: ATP-binding cassette domain-containing protein [Alphaproteobacteria bacterium]|nr:ATP-binding cassette domain-containing protein [Alphaproteobacteria bacterium]
MSALISLDHVTVKFGRQTALRDISGVFHKGSLTAIAGPNGAGKSTLLKTIVGLVRPSQGVVSIKAGVSSVAYLPQLAAVQRDFPATVLMMACMGFWPTFGNVGSIDAARRRRALAALAEVGLESMADRPISGLSGGQFQRLLFARVMVQDAPVILLDEPFASVDAETTMRLIKILLDWHRQGKTIICVLHDLLMIQKYFPDSFVLAGKCLGHGHTHDLLEENLLSFDLDMAELCAGPEAEGHQKHD